MGPGLRSPLSSVLGQAGPLGAVLSSGGANPFMQAISSSSPFLAALLQGTGATPAPSPAGNNPLGVDPWENMREVGPMPIVGDRPANPMTNEVSNAAPAQPQAPMLAAQPTPLSVRSPHPNATSVRGGNDVAAYAYNHYIQAGLSPAHAAGIVGNLGVESANWDPNVIGGSRRGDAGSAGYAGQWRGSRLTNLEAFSRERGHNNPTLDDQLDFVLHEGKNGLDQGAATAYQMALNAATPQEASDIYSKYYERPGTPFNERRRALAAAAAGLPNTGYTPPTAEAGAVAQPGISMASMQPPAAQLQGPAPAEGVAFPQQPQQTTEDMSQKPNPFDPVLAQIKQTADTTPLRTLDQQGKLALIARLGEQSRSNFIAKI